MLSELQTKTLNVSSGPEALDVAILITKLHSSISDLPHDPQAVPPSRLLSWASSLRES